MAKFSFPRKPRHLERTWKIIFYNNYSFLNEEIESTKKWLVLFLENSYSDYLLRVHRGGGSVLILFTIIFGPFCLFFDMTFPILNFHPYHFIFHLLRIQHKNMGGHIEKERLIPPLPSGVGVGVTIGTTQYFFKKYFTTFFVFRCDDSDS